jgi:hypothetical protein
MRINYHKSDMTPINLDEREANQYTQVFCCKVGIFPFRYLGIPLHFDKLKSDEVWYHRYHIFWTRQGGIGGPTMSRSTQSKGTGQKAHN